MAIQRTTKKRIEALEQASPNEDKTPTHIYLVSPCLTQKPVLYWVRPDHRSNEDDETSCLPDHQGYAA